eukprot:CAMPEP_0202977038 /NCGR_PEP_ID=MMETSP1396-20130829/82766_1 /ASSEMBLY_ACC=CAM_ASM_000872 /TAXON_ID= /ORGANISM="Pseudokeronopsis sp., Strain Brazil" /LENGTH=61 /DNA_ID=CAMNT_0049715469 /DNA_START=1 /DNA_END=186 /DNA_ORIENTATION=-
MKVMKERIEVLKSSVGKAEAKAEAMADEALLQGKNVARERVEKEVLSHQRNLLEESRNMVD